MTHGESVADLLTAIEDAIDTTGYFDSSNQRYSLYDYIDTEVLRMLVRRDDAEWQLRFRVEEYVVVVDNEASVTVHPAD